MKHSPPPRMVVPWLISLAMALLQIPYCCQGQELPSFEIKPFTDNVTYRSSYCFLYEQMYLGNVDRRDGLRGRDISVALFDYQLDPKTGGISNDQIAVKFLDELARRAGFEWRNTYGALESPSINNNYTYDSLLTWGTGVFDVMGEYYVRNIERLEMGIDFIDVWYDGSTVMVMRKSEEGFQWFTFFKPFSLQVWILIIISTFVTAIYYYIIDYLESRQKSKLMEASLSDHMFYAPFAFTGHSMYNPRTISTRLVAWSLCFMFLVLLAIYTANMATLLIVQGELSVVVNTLEDAIQADLTICVWESAATDNYLLANHKNAKRLPFHKESECEAALVRGDCHVYLTFASSWEILKRNSDYNGDCRLDWVGRTVMNTGGSFTVQDNQALCSKFLEDVLTLHMVDMIIDGTRKKIWEDYYRSISSHNCENGDEDTADEELNVNAKQIGSLFVLHFALSTIALIIALVKFSRVPKEKRTKITKELKARPAKLTLAAMDSVKAKMRLSKRPPVVEDKRNNCEVETHQNIDSHFESEAIFTVSPPMKESPNTDLFDICEDSSIALSDKQSLMLNDIQKMIIKLIETDKQKNI